MSYYYYLVLPGAKSRAAGFYYLSIPTPTKAKPPINGRTALEEMGNPQPPTLVSTDNSTVLGILTSPMRQTLSKAFDMRYYWVKDRIKQGQFDLRLDK
eukprot:4689571-Ditylum_brightwellii.AAC.1